MVEVHNNRARFFDGGCEVQSNLIIKNWINQGVILEDQVAKEGFFFQGSSHFLSGVVYRQLCCPRCIYNHWWLVETGAEDVDLQGMWGKH